MCTHTHAVCHFQEPLSRKLTLIPPGEEVTMVTWEELEQAIADGWKASQGVNKSTGGAGAWQQSPPSLSLFTVGRCPVVQTLRGLFIVSHCGYFSCSPPFPSSIP